MFAHAVHVNPELVAEGRTAHGAWIDLHLREQFHYTRGFTDLRIYDEAKAMTRPGRLRAKREFALWIGAQAHARGLEIDAVRLRKHTRPVGRSRERTRTLIEVDLVP